MLPTWFKVLGPISPSAMFFQFSYSRSAAGEASKIWLLNSVFSHLIKTVLPVLFRMENQTGVSQSVNAPSREPLPGVQPVSSETVSINGTDRLLLICPYPALVITSIPESPFFDPSLSIASIIDLFAILIKLSMVFTYTFYKLIT